MRDGRDADDARLLAHGEFARLLAIYEPVIVQRCVAALRGSLEAEDVAQDVKLRLWRELQAGKTYPVPFRVVVHQVITWTIKDHLAGRSTAQPLPDGWDEAASLNDPNDHLIVEEILADLPPRERDAFSLFVDGLSPDQIAAELRTTRNAVDQALHRARVKLRERLARG